MPVKPLAVNPQSPPDDLAVKPDKTLRLDSGREIRVYPGDQAERIEITSSSGQVVVRLEMTADGPLMVVEGARLAFRAAEEISLEADRVNIDARESAAIRSKGKMSIESDKDMKIDSPDDIRVTGKMIYLN